MRHTAPVRHPDETERTINQMNLEAFERVREVVGHEVTTSSEAVPDNLPHETEDA